MIVILYRVLKLLLAFCLLLLGIAGAVLPILNGTIFIILALIIISFESTYVKHKLHFFTKKNAMLHKLHLYLENFLKKIFRIKD